jgi:hypothetical protein
LALFSPSPLLQLREGSDNNIAVMNSNQSRYVLHTKWATTCAIGSSRYKNLKLKKKEKKERISIALKV